MVYRILSIEDLDQILFLEYQMYWQKKGWQELWKNRGEKLFRNMIKEYLVNFPRGCFGVFDEKEGLSGVMIISKISEVKTIPYIHSFKDYFEESGNIAYVQIFAIKNCKKEVKIAKDLYRGVEKMAKTNECNKIVVVIYSSLVEEAVLKQFGYKIERDDLRWEIFPDKYVDCRIYTKTI